VPWHQLQIYVAGPADDRSHSLNLRILGMVVCKPPNMCAGPAQLPVYLQLERGHRAAADGAARDPARRVHGTRVRRRGAAGQQPHRHRLRGHLRPRLRARRRAQRGAHGGLCLSMSCAACCSSELCRCPAFRGRVASKRNAQCRCVHEWAELPPVTVSQGHTVAQAGLVWII